MPSIVIVTRGALLIARYASFWTVEEYLSGRSPECVAVDPHSPNRMYCGTVGAGLFRSQDSGRTWESVGQGIIYSTVMAVAVSHEARKGGLGIVYAGTEPIALFRSDNGGDSWEEQTSLLALPSHSTWSFPPRPDTSHVRWIEADLNVADRLFVAIEAGALVRSFDGGRTWHDRVVGGPYDTHTAATHLLAPGRIYSAAGDGYYESRDSGETWSSPVDGLKHGYLVGVAVDPADPDTVIVSAARGPGSAYSPQSANTHIYRKTGRKPWEQVMSGLPQPEGMSVSRFATFAGEPGVFYAANNRGLFKSEDAGQSWKVLDVPWPKPGLANGVQALVCLPE